MKKLIFVFAGALGCATPMLAQSADAAPNLHFYAQASAVLAVPGELDVGGGAALALGVTVNDVHSYEANLIYFESGQRGIELDFMPILATYRRTWRIDRLIAIDLGVGAGITVQKPTGWLSTYGDTTSALTGGFIGGVSYILAKGITLEAEAYALCLENTRYTSSGFIGVFTLGLKFEF